MVSDYNRGSVITTRQDGETVANEDKENTF